ncbi:MAG: PD-(D/E)XK nuclease-like domain-containing protein [Burkholderiales bacterium]
MPSSYKQLVSAVDEPMEVYLSQKGYISSSKLRKIAEGTTEVNLPKRSRFLMGDAFHSFVLEPSVFNRCYIEAEASFADKNDQRQKLTAEQFLNLSRARSKLFEVNGGCYQKLIGEGRKELSIYWSDDRGVRFKVRPDLIFRDLIVDLKTFSPSTRKAFLADPYRRGYLLQAALYREAITLLTDRVPQFAFLIVELSKPYRITWDLLGSEQLNYATSYLSKIKSQFLQDGLKLNN